MDSLPVGVPACSEEPGWAKPESVNSYKHTSVCMCTDWETHTCKLRYSHSCTLTLSPIKMASDDLACVMSFASSIYINKDGSFWVFSTGSCTGRDHVHYANLVILLYKQAWNSSVRKSASRLTPSWAPRGKGLSAWTHRYMDNCSFELIYWLGCMLIYTSESKCSCTRSASRARNIFQRQVCPATAE